MTSWHHQEQQVHFCVTVNQCSFTETMKEALEQINKLDSIQVPSPQLLCGPTSLPAKTAGLRYLRR